MVYEVSISTNYSISNFCYPHDPIKDLSFRISRMLALGCDLIQDGSRIAVRADEDASDTPLTALYHIVDDKEFSYYDAEHLDFDSNPEINEAPLTVRLDRSIIPYFSAQLQDKINNDDDLMDIIKRQVNAILHVGVSISKSEISFNERCNSRIEFKFTLKYNEDQNN